MSLGNNRRDASSLTVKVTVTLDGVEMQEGTDLDGPYKNFRLARFYSDANLQGFGDFGLKTEVSALFRRWHNHMTAGWINPAPSDPINDPSRFLDLTDGAGVLWLRRDESSAGQGRPL